MLRRTVILGLLTAPLWAALVDAQEAGPTPAAIQAALHSETGWVSHASKDEGVKAAQNQGVGKADEECKV